MYWGPEHGPGWPDPQVAEKRTEPHLNTLSRAFKAVGHYPKAMIELALTVLSVSLGLAFLPSLGVAAPPSQMAITYLELDRSANVPTYILDQPADQSKQDGPQNLITIGMDVPPTSRPVSWTLFVDYAKGDHLTHIKPQSGVSNGPTDQPDQWRFGGTMHPGSHSYSEFRYGYLTNQLTDLNTPTDDEVISFEVSGQVNSQVISGSRLAVGEPSIAAFLYNSVPSTIQQEPPAPFNAEVLYDAGSYELQGSGPSVTGPPANMNWDWFGQNGLQSMSAVGVNTADEQTDQNHLFLAAVFFGLSAAAGAAFALELVNAIQEHGSEHRRRKPGALAARKFQV
jgi:hypothetical protein